MQTFNKNLKGRDWIVGDIHGNFSKLTDTMQRAGFDFDNDRLFCTGDLVDRGPESEQVLEWLGYPWFFSVLGNHERMLIDHFDQNMYAEPEWIMLHNGAEWFLSLSEDKQALYANAFRELPMMIQVGDVGLVHAEAPEDWLVPDTEFVAIWSRMRIQYKDVKGTANIRKVYLGHTPVHTRTTLGNNIYIDTASVNLGTGEFTLEEI